MCLNYGPPTHSVVSQHSADPDREKEPRGGLIGVGGAMVRSIYSFTGVRMGAPLAFSSTTTNLAGSVVLALRPTM